MSIYITADVFSTDGFFATEVRQYVNFFKSANPAVPNGEVLVPGEPERRRREARLAEGISMPDDTWQAILGTLRDVGAKQPDLEQAPR